MFHITDWVFKNLMRRHYALMETNVTFLQARLLPTICTHIQILGPSEKFTETFSSTHPPVKEEFGG